MGPRLADGIEATFDERAAGRKDAEVERAEERGIDGGVDLAAHQPAAGETLFLRKPEMLDDRLAHRRRGLRVALAAL